MKKRGISLIVLVITIIVIAILASAVILTMLNPNNPVDLSKKAKFMSDYRTVQEGVNVFSLGKYNAETNEFELPLKGYLTVEDKTYITDKVPTLKTKIEELSGTLDTVNLAWISSEDIGVKLSNNKAEKGYIMDVTNRLIYDYNGDYFEGQMWHTLDGGVTNVELGPEPEMWDGWIKLTLFYPSNSTERMWRLSSDGETRTDTNLAWKNYTGPITVPLSSVEDIWIKYKIDGTTIVNPPPGVALVDIQPDTTAKYVTSVKVNIIYDSDATIKEYKVGDGGWKTYTGEFTVTENCIIEARVVKPDNVYDGTGKLITRRNAENADAYYIGNIKQPGPTVDDALLPPNIARLNPSDSTEVAKVKVTYPADAVTKVYRMDYGIEETYSEDISIKEYGTYIIAYYYNADGKRSLSARLLIDKDGSGPTYDDLVAPTINNLGKTKDGEITSLSITYPSKAVNKVYTVNGGSEVSYTGDISVTAYRTYVKAYYYDASGRQSNYDWIYIKEGTTDGPKPPPPPTYEIPVEPEIILSPSTVTTSTQVSVVAPEDADRIYISVGYGAYKLYTSPITLSNNTTIRSYYLTYSGKKSYTAYKRVNNIRTPGPDGLTMPYVGIDITPYTNSLINKVSVSLAYADADTVEYSFDGIIYKAYTGAFDVTENCTIYARAINVNGTSKDKESITNIGRKPPKPKTKLDVNISVAPEPSVTTILVDKVKVSIRYDAEATEKYYAIGAGGTLVPYTGEFEVTKNCTIYAYALSATGNGTDIKVIDNIVDGISDPVITSNPDNSVLSSKDKITITYDKNATLKQYRINGAALRDYTGEFEVTENCTIYAYSKNAKGQISTYSYTVTNIPAPPRVVTIDYGKYFLLKLNYPPESATREYKWKEIGTWKSYKEAGILLIKPQYKSEFVDVSGGIIVKIKDENGVETTFTGDYYLLDVGLSEINENIFMRWDRISPNAPEIVPDTIESAKEVNVTINYASYLIKKQYKVVDKDGNIVTDWTDYKGPIKITANNTTVYAKGQDDAEVWTSESNKKITNIDELPPEIKLTLDATTAVQTVPVRVSVTDDVAVGKVKWAAGTQGESYFVAGGIEISNNSVVKITGNGYYTFYAEDKAGNTQVYTLNVTNVDLTAPKIDIQVNPETTVGLTANVTIDYGDSVTKQYKVGTNNATWTNYTNTFAISSYTILTNNWQNADGTVTVYAKGKDSAGNEITVQKKVVSLDLDRPKSPVINSNAGYPVLTTYGVKFDAITSIVYDTRTDIENYYSINNGTTWNLYTESFILPSGTIMAKSVKKDTKLEVSVSKTISMPSNALPISVYDGSDTTGITTGTNLHIMIDSSMQGKYFRLKAGVDTAASNYANFNLDFVDSSKIVISSYKVTASTFDGKILIPANTKWILYNGSTVRHYSGSTLYPHLYEIQSANEPTFSAINGYISLNADPTKAIKKPYQMVSISYSPTSVQRLYRIGTTGDWLNYEDKAIWVNQGETIYSKGIDQYGIATRITSSYTVNVTSALPYTINDGNDTTGITTGTNLYMMVDNSMQGKYFRLRCSVDTAEGNYMANFNLDFLDANKVKISSYKRTGSGIFDGKILIPANTKWILYNGSTVGHYSGSTLYPRFYEIQPSNEPTFSATNGYITLSADSTKEIRKPYQNVSINYFATSVQKFYRVGTTGDWLNYENKAIWVNQGETIYAKGIDQYGNETRIISSYTVNVTNALPATVNDGNDTTGITTGTNLYMMVDNSMQGKYFRLVCKVDTAEGNYAAYFNLDFLDANKVKISSYRRTAAGLFNGNILIPANTRWILYNGSTVGHYSGATLYPRFYEIQAIK